MPITIIMNYIIDNENYEVVIERKNNKNIYIRVKDDLKIYVTCNYFYTKKQITCILDNNLISIKKMLERKKRIVEKNSMFFYLGKKYDIITVPAIDNIDIDYQNDNIYVKDKKHLEKWYKNEIIRIFTDRFNHCFQLFNENVTMPQLKIRNMKTRWGVYNRKNHSVTLNTHLIEHEIDKLDYVIYHELSHIIHFNHSEDFWNLVSKYCPNYKEIRKEMKE